MTKQETGVGDREKDLFLAQAEAYRPTLADGGRKEVFETDTVL